MNLFFGDIRKVLSKSEFEKLQAAQRLWVQFREANCVAEKSLYDGGSAAPMVYAACMESDTRKRAEELRAMFGWRIEKWKR